MIDHEQTHHCCRGRGHRNGGGERPGQGHRHSHDDAECALNAPLDADPPLTAEAEAAVLAALDDEYHARAFYRAVMRRFGEVQPFSHIEQSESRHIAALTRVLKHYGRTTPADPHDGSPAIESAVPGAFAQACAAAERAEVDNDLLYQEKLLPQVRDYPGIAAVFSRLMEASRERHRPAFGRWAADR